jgi:5-oxoprolinase (ATP-hydrolysing)
VAQGMATFVDRGGTFTDVVTVDASGRAALRKVPSDRAVVGALAEGKLRFGTTVATNALLEGKGVSTLLLVSRGFGDLASIGDMTRPGLFEPDRVRSPSLANEVLEVLGRIGSRGEELEALVKPNLALKGIEAVAIVLMNSPLNPAHELALAERIREQYPNIYISLGHQVAAELGYLARIETALVDAAITPLLRRAMTRDKIPSEAQAICSDGSLIAARDFTAPDAVLSGPAGGVLAVAAVAAMAGFDRAVGLDMGGTSTDVCRVERDDIPRVEGHVAVAGVRLSRPILEVETIAAGGGSVLTNDGFRLGVGPESAGADPGPQCYGKGGPPTLTDAALALGLVDEGSFEPPLDASAVRIPGDPQEFVDIAREAMAAAVRKIATGRGVDLADHALVAYGGAAGQHAAAVAGRLGINTVLVHPLAAGLSAFGQTFAREEYSAVRPVWEPLETAWDHLERLWGALQDELPKVDSVERSLDLRYSGTDHAIQVSGSDAAAVKAGFEEQHQRRYGFLRPGAILEVVNARVRVRGPVPEAVTVDADPWGLEGREVIGPSLLVASTTAVHVPAGWRAQLEGGLLRLDRIAAPEPTPKTARTPFGVTLWGNRFMAVAEQAGCVLQRLARSVNIKERLDFSCAIFDSEGQLIANAPHIPVHLGAMGETVRDLIASGTPLINGQAWLTNDPAAGGSHLPDLTVVTAVEKDGRRFFVASRGHHVDVGGVTPGSMPPHSRSIEEEGFVVRHLPLMENGRLADLSEVLSQSRQPATLLGDIEAQLAANRHGASCLDALGDGAVIATWMAHILDVGDELMTAVFAALPAASADDWIAGVPLSMALKPSSDGLLVDFSGTGPPHRGNLNAPPAVVRAAVLYSLRLLVGRAIPLNEGALRRVRFAIPKPSILWPPPGAAVAGGNVETSQRLVDLFLMAAGYMAASQGTMNNLTIGGEGWSLYETLGGGQGASPRGPGPSARQVHMTNTRITDPEVIEARMPLRVTRFSHRSDSGGIGEHSGGDGLVREFEVQSVAEAALLATRRSVGAPGINAASGRPGCQWIYRAEEQRWEPWDGRSVTLKPGDRVRVATPGGGGWSPATSPR